MSLKPEERSWVESLHRGDSAIPSACLAASLIAASTDAVVGTTLDGVVSFWSKGAEACFGYSSEEMLGTSIDRLAVSGPSSEVFEGVRAGRRIEQAGARRRTRDGSIIDLALVVAPIRDEKGSIVGALHVARDRTDPMRGRGRIGLADELLAMLTQELRDPLSAILNGVHLLKMYGKVDPDTFEFSLASIDRQVYHVLRMMDDVNDLSIVVRGEDPLRKEPVDLAAVVDRAVGAVRPLLEGRGQRPMPTLPDHPLHIEGDAARLEQILETLLASVANSAENEAEVPFAVTGEGDVLRLVVGDVGESRPGETRELAGAGGRSPALADGGLGIGLTLAKTLVEAHGGSVVAKGAGPRRWSGFDVRLPGLVKAAGRQPPRRAATGAASTRRVLVVDDNVDANGTLSRLLELIGHEVRAAYTGPDAVEAAIEFRPEIVLLDIGLPGFDGYEVARRLRQGDASRDSSIIAITGYGQEEDRRRSKEAGFDHHLVKPLDFGKLMILLSQAS